MNRRALGRGRLLVALGSVLSVAGMLPAWWVITRTNAEALSGNGFEGVGVLIFLAGLAMVAVVTLPFATPDGISTLDRPAAYVLLALIAIAAFLWRIYEISRFDGLGLPNEAPGLWISGVGLLIVAWGVGDILTERPPTY